MFRRRKGQGTLEYIIVFTVIVAAILLASNTFIRDKIRNILEHSTQQAENAVNRIRF